MTDTEKKEYLSKVEATLKHGRISWGNRKAEIIAYIIFTVLMIAGAAGLVTFLSFEFINKSYDIVEFICLIILTIFVFSGLPVIFLVFLLKNEKAWKEVRTWLDDAVETGAYSYLYGTYIPGGALFGNTIYRIKINFKIDGKHISCISKDYQWGSFLPNGYSLYWKKYADKEVKILYSPKYEEVMILKEPNNK